MLLSWCIWRLGWDLVNRSDRSVCPQMKTSFIPHFMIKSDTFVVYLPDFSPKKTSSESRIFFPHQKWWWSCKKVQVKSIGIHLFFVEISGRLGFSEKVSLSQMLSHGRLEDTWCGVAWPLKIFGSWSRTLHEGSAGYTPSWSPKNASVPKQFPNVFDPKSRIHEFTDPFWGVDIELHM